MRFQQIPIVGLRCHWGTTLSRCCHPRMSLGQDRCQGPAQPRSSSCNKLWRDKSPDWSHSRGSGFGESVNSEMEGVILKGGPLWFMWRRWEGSTVLQKTFWHPHVPSDRALGSGCIVSGCTASGSVQPCCSWGLLLAAHTTHDGWGEAQWITS